MGRTWLPRRDAGAPGTVFFAAPGYGTEERDALVATGLTDEGQQLVDGEEIERYEVPLSEVKHLIQRGEIPDSKTRAVLAFFFANVGTL